MGILAQTATPASAHPHIRDVAVVVPISTSPGLGDPGIATTPVGGGGTITIGTVTA